MSTNEEIPSTADDIRALIGKYLVDGDVRHKRILAALDETELRHACGAWVQIVAFGKPVGDFDPEKGGMTATAARMAILAGYSRGRSLTGGEEE